LLAGFRGGPLTFSVRVPPIEGAGDPVGGLKLAYKPFNGAFQRCLFSVGNLVSIGFSGFALIWSSAQ